MYTKYHKSRGGKCTGCRHIPHVLKLLPPFHSVLDAGCAHGKTVRLFQKAGKHARGVEMFEEPLKLARDLVKQGVVKQQALVDLDAPTSSFDLVYNTDVLEHVPPGDTLLAICQLVRVTKRYLFVIVGTNEKNSRYGDDESDPWVHEVLKPAHWWIQRFKQFGAELDTPLTKSLTKALGPRGDDNVMVFKRMPNAVSECKHVEGNFHWNSITE